MLANHAAHSLNTLRGQLFGKAVLWVAGASMAILLSIQATTWAHAMVRTWFFTAVNGTFASGPPHAIVR